ncbi:MAG TPA: hypothetical protein VJR70_04575 [Stellaceae bacterium]|nr:hypothetical protein [Stellaceae bacterium]
MSDRPSGAALRLTCQPSKSGNVLLFPYRLANDGPGDAYAMQAAAAGTAASEAPVVIAGDDGDAIVGLVAAPLPTDRRLAVPVVPLARRLAAGEAFEGRVEIALPVAESSPYFPELTLRRYDIVELKGIRFTIAYWPADTGDLVTRSFGDGADLLRVLTADPAGSAKLASQRFPTNGLQLFRRTDAFPRTLK